ncbi:8-oxoguanine deaminase [Yinghuangia soli]|uniref:8-oxoguanine deaminase n=1 Tax=Yinghuangia soli TaxID=2908204 RepID=A0AA41Q7V0_9ACTN|nr:8-oxoguanine deaminase [Yinghuangia soli]MCF2531984.1 8-oxoguanine deaminase [Yinghuangia soli]
MNRPHPADLPTGLRADGPVDLLVEDAGVLVAETGVEIPGGWIAVRGTAVAALGGPADPRPAAARVISAGGRLVTPGLINTHHHIYQNLTRSFAPVVHGTLFEWLTGLYPVWSRLDEEAVEVSTYIGLAELLLGGCTTSTDHLYVHPRPRLIDAQIRAAQAIGFRFHPTRGSMTRGKKDGGLPPDIVVQSHEQVLEDSERLIAAYHDPSPGAMLQIALAPCSPFSVTEEVMRDTAEMAERHGVRLHTHLAEDHDEDSYCLEVYGCRPVEYFERVGWGSDRSWVAHCIYPNEAEMARLAQWGTGVAHCPSSNMLIGHGTAPVTRMRELGLPVGLGCDGSASTDHASLWLEARTALALSRYRNGPGAGLTARDVLDIATRGSAACLGRADLGVLRAGSPADLVVWQADEVALAGAHSDPVEAWLRCGPARAGTTVVNGRVLVDDGRLTLGALPDMLAAHRRISLDMQGLAD